MKNKFVLRDLLYNKKFTVTLSLLLSFIVWLVVMTSRNPIREQTFTDLAANITVENTSAGERGLGIVSDILSQKFTVTVSGPNYVVSQLKPADILLSASVVDVTDAGEYELDIVATRNSSLDGYTFTSVSPNKIKVLFDYMDGSKDFTVTPKLIGVGATSGLEAETPIVANSEQSTVNIKGRRSVIDKIDSVVAYAEVNKTLSATETYDTDLILYDKNGNVLYRYAFDGTVFDKNDTKVENNYLTLSAASVKVTQPISKRAKVPVEVTFSNKPSGYTKEMFTYTVDHSVVTVIGAPDVIDKLQKITLSPIDFRDISTQSTGFEVSATLPDGVKILDNIEYFTVNINLRGYIEKTFTVSEIKTSGINSSLTASVSGNIKNVKICGPAAIVNKIKPTDLYAAADLRDKSAGTHTIDAVIKSNAYPTVWQVGSYTATVTLQAK